MLSHLKQRRKKRGDSSVTSFITPSEKRLMKEWSLP